MDTGAGRISKLSKKWRKPRNNNNSLGRRVREKQHDTLHASRMQTGERVRVSHHLGLCDSAFIIGVLYVNLQQSKAFEYFSTAVAHLLLLSTDWYSIVLCCSRLAEANSSLCVCAHCCHYICDAIKYRIFHIKFHGFYRKFLLHFIGFVYRTGHTVASFLP